MNNRPPRDPPSLARQYPTLEGVAVPQPLKTAIRHAYQHIYDLRDDLLKRLNALQLQQGELGASGPSTSVFHYRADTTSTSASDPGAGKVRWDNSTQSSATFLYFDWLTADDFDVTVLWSLMDAPNQFVIQDKDLAINHQIWQMTGPAIMMPDWFQVPVTFVSSSGAGVFSNNQQISVLIPAASGGGGGGGGVTAVTGTPPIASSGGTTPAISIATFTGDSGSGGARGAVPAPAAGDGAAGKVLGAGGGWVTGGSSGVPAYISSLFVGPDATRTITGATHGLATAALLAQVYDNASPRNAIATGWTVNASTFDVVITFASAQSNYYVVIK